jgi:hypothetical protein
MPAGLAGLRDLTGIPRLKLFQSLRSVDSQGQSSFVLVTDRRASVGEQLEAQAPGDQRQNAKRDVCHTRGVEQSGCQGSSSR